MTQQRDEATMRAPALERLRVLDLTDGIAGQYCGRLFADFGADVVLVEPPEGSATRRTLPLTETRAAPENSLLFWHLNGGKRATASADWQALAAEADVILVDTARRQEVGEAGSRIICRFSEFGDTGPYRRWQGGEMIQQALAGVMYVTGSAQREPLFGAGRRAAYAAGVTAFDTILAALLVRERSGLGQDVEATAFDAAAAMAQQLVTQYDLTQSYPVRGLYEGGGMMALLELLDGWIALWVQRDWPVVCDIFGIPDAAKDPRFRDFTDLRANWRTAVPLLAEAARDMSVDAVFEPLQKAKFCIATIAGPADVLKSPHYVEREMFGEVEETPGMQALGPVFRPEGPHRVARAAPRLDEAPITWRADALPRPAPAALTTNARPLDGVRVLDLTLAWAGPFASRGLAFLGADVIKVENAAPLDPWRGPLRATQGSLLHIGREPHDNPWDRHSLFMSQNHDKRSISLNLKSPEGQALARDLAAASDVVIANFSPRVLDRLGLGYAALSARNPRLVMVEMPAFGNTGPWSGHVGVGKTMEAAAGMCGMIGYGDGLPYMTGPAYLDPIGGLHGAGAVLMGLYQRERDGRGQYIEVSQVEAAMHWIGEYILAAAIDGVDQTPDGNRQPDAAPHDAFPAAGDDEWVAIAAYDDEQWRNLVALTELEVLAAPEFATLAGRKENEALIHAALSEWTVRHDKHDAAALLQAAGVPAAPVTKGGDVYRDAHLRTRGMIRTLDHAEAGAYDLSSLPYTLSRTPGAMMHGAPLFGADAHAVLAEVLNMGAAEVDRLVADDVVRLTPILPPTSSKAS